MLTKITSGGQTGADRAALDFAIDFDISHGGWIPKGCKPEDGVLPDKYQLQEMPATSYPKHTEQNVMDADGTLIFSHGKLTDGSALTLQTAKKHDRPWLHVNLNKTNGFEAARSISKWISDNDIDILNVAGSRASKDPGIYDATYKVLSAAFHLASVMTTMDRAEQVRHRPKTVDEAVDIIISKLTFKDKARIARMPPEEASALPVSLGDYIWVRLGLRDGNEELMESCCLTAGTDELHRERAIDVIVEAVWKKLRQSHRLRPVK